MCGLFSVRPAEFGLQLTFSGFIRIEEIVAWRRDAANMLLAQHGPFAVLVDARELKALPDDVWPLLLDMQKIFKDGGMIRSAVIVSSPFAEMMFRRIARGSGIDVSERVLRADSPLWLERALAWLEDGTEPAPGPGS